ncbi:MAG: phosphatase PAP2 family protein [Alistipes sp.]|jgi:undecaprenyl-diphosphatase|nr:phosphatase PAP2 family protein [Alistipes sp.]
MSVTWDWPLFEALNFDGGTLLDGVMSAISGVVMWLPLYALIIYMVWRRYSWRGVVVLIGSIGVAMGLADTIAGIFKHTGMLGELWPSFPVRPRPMFTEGLENLHVVSYSHGLYGTVSAHAATIVALAVISSVVLRRRWFTWTMVGIAIIVCYSRIYLACHFPQDILIGIVVGLLTGYLGARLFGYVLKRWTR